MDSLYIRVRWPFAVVYHTKITELLGIAHVFTILNPGLRCTQPVITLLSACLEI